METMDCIIEKAAKDDEVAKPAIILKIKVSRFLKPFECSVCPCSYAQSKNLTYHIRREHFNLVAKITAREKRKVNDVWVESVINSDDAIEIKKTGHSKYLMKKSTNAGSVPTKEFKHRIDLRTLYPDLSTIIKSRVSCNVCRKKFLKRDFPRHLQDHKDEVA